ncbi:MAG TPA: hypothetical protein VKE22_03950 [Haliangiales bacterium]|nr:hypothetical protein [Haliangiales bacterium]
MFDEITNTVSSVWGSASSAVSGLWAPSEPAAPISVPVTAAQEANARRMVDAADAWDAAGHTGSRGDEQQARNVADWKARDAGFADAQAQKEFREGSAAWNQALDAYLAGKGPSPGPRDEFVRKHARGE